MTEILETNLLEFGKSTFLVDLVKHETGTIYIEIAQNIVNKSSPSQKLKINPSVLTNLLVVLHDYQNKLSSKKSIKDKYLADVDQEKIINRYLKGISIREISMHFDQKQAFVEMVLRNNGIEIVSNKIPRRKFWNKRK